LSNAVSNVTWREGTRDGAKLVTKKPDKEGNTPAAPDGPPGRERTMREEDARAARLAAQARSAAKGGLRLSIVLPLAILALAALPACGEASGVKDEMRAAETSTAEFAVYALSRGKGVPEPTRGALRKAHTLLEGAKQSGKVIRLKEARIGLEGETRLCVEAKDVAAARALLRELRAIAENVELFNVVVEPCLNQ
jgi:hypothetical protein